MSDCVSVTFVESGTPETFENNQLVRDGIVDGVAKGKLAKGLEPGDRVFVPSRGCMMTVKAVEPRPDTAGWTMSSPMSLGAMIAEGVLKELKVGKK